MRLLSRRVVLALLAVSLLSLPALAQSTTVRVSVSSDGSQGNSESGYSSISADGRHVAFESYASNLVPDDTNGTYDVFVRDTVAGTTRRVSVASDGSQGNDHSGYRGPSISADGRYVVFWSEASNLVAGDTNGSVDIFVRDTVAGATRRVSVASDGTEANDGSDYPSISADGRYMVFRSYASNLVAGDTNGSTDIFVRNTVAGTTRRVSVASDGTQGIDGSDYPSISAEGRYVAFQSDASNLVAGDTNGTQDIFVRDTVAGTTRRVSVASDGSQANDGSGVPSISADGRHVAFYSDASNLVAGDTNGTWDVFVRDTVAETTRLVSVTSDGIQGNGYSDDASISADGRYVAFYSYASNLVAGDTNGSGDVFVRDTVVGTTRRVSVSSDGSQGNSDSGWPSISADGRYVAFWSWATNLVAGDTNGESDAFVHGPLFDLLPFGDVDGDGRFTWSDVTLALRYSAGLSAAPAGAATRADVLPNGLVDLRDVAVLLRAHTEP